MPAIEDGGPLHLDRDMIMALLTDLAGNSSTDGPEVRDI
jgi:hypothetical protein